MLGHGMKTDEVAHLHLLELQKACARSFAHRSGLVIYYYGILIVYTYNNIITDEVLFKQTYPPFPG